MSSGALPGPDLLRVIPGVLRREGLEGLGQEPGGGGSVQSFTRPEHCYGDERLGHRLDDDHRKGPSVLLYRRRPDRYFRLHAVTGQAELRGLQVVAAVHGAPGVLALGAVDLNNGREAGLGGV